MSVQVFFANFHYILGGAWVTIKLALFSIVFGSSLGIALGLTQLLGPRMLRTLLRAWIYCIRGVPVLVIMFFLYFALPALKVRASAFVTVVAALIVYLSAFYAEIFRGALESVPRGQREAALTLGMSRIGAVRDVLLPQAMPLMIAPWLNISVIAVKSTAYASIVGLWELTMASREVVERTLAAFDVFFGTMLIYFVICFPLSLIARRLGRGPKILEA